MIVITKYCHLFFIFFIIPLISFSQKDKAKIVAAYINNFATYTIWPNETQMDSFRIALITDNADVVKEFQNLSNKRKIKNKPISLTTKSFYTFSKKVNMIFLTTEKADLISSVYDNIEGLPILLVSEDYKEKRNIMINLYKTDQGQILFEVNKANIYNQTLIIDPEILLAGGTEVDVASLYRKSQNSLRNMQKQMDKMTDSLNNLQIGIKNSNDVIKIKQAEIVAQKELLASSAENLTINQKIIASREMILKSQKDSIYRKNFILQNQLKEIKKQWKEIDDQEKLLRSKQKKIEELNNEIENKDIDLENKSETIVRQRNTLFLTILIGFLVISLGVVIFFAYRSNKKKKEILSNQKREIEDKLLELNELNVKLKIADQYKSIFLASMSHELRTPLNSIIGYTGILLMGMTGDLNEEQNKQLSKVKNNAKHLLSLINDILDISKIEANRVELEIEKFQLVKLVNEVVETLYPKASEKKLELTSSIHEDLVITTDYRRLKQVVLNLVANAVNYTNTGKIHMFSEYLPENKFRLCVKDTGVGISKDEMHRLFQPFQQIDSSMTKKNSSGTGLGLYLCRKIMRLLYGDIFLKSELGKGSEFYIEMQIEINK